MEKGDEEAQRLVNEAHQEAQKVLEEAQKKAEQILAEAQKSADELSNNTKSELKLFAGQAVNALKTEIYNLLTNQPFRMQLKGLFQIRTSLTNSS